MEEALRRIRRWKKQKKPRKWLNVSGLGLTELPLIPSKVRRLLCVRNQLKTFDNLPKRLQELACGGNTFETLETLPPNLKKLYCCGVKTLKCINKVPDSIEYMNLGYCSYLETIYHLPSCLESLDLRDTYRLNYIEYFPPNLNHIYITDADLETLPPLPVTLTVLECLHMKNLNYLPKLPESLLWLSIYSCNLQSLPDLPSQLQFLEIDSNHDLIPPTNLPNTLVRYICDQSELCFNNDD